MMKVNIVILIVVMMKMITESESALLNLFGLNSSPLVILAVTTFLCGVNAFGEEVSLEDFYYHLLQLI
jgi:hypothetical protein